jgi:hypothetical protein
MVQAVERRVSRESVFALKVDFNPETTNPGKMFLALSGLSNALQATDQTLIQSLNLRIQPILLIEDIEKGSLLVWIRNFLESIDDDSIKDLNLKKLIGGYLVKGKYIVINFINNRDSISSKDEIIELQAELIQEAEQTGISGLSIYNPINQRDILANINQIKNALSELDSEEKVYYYLNPSQSIPFNKAFNISPESIEDLATDQILNAKIPMILKVKKPDYLGESKWEFRHERKKIEAKITDLQWLQLFRSRKIDLRPGDALKVEVEVETRYDLNGEVISIQYTIFNVVEVIPISSTEQISMQEIENTELDFPEFDN